jgi:hypothetical protein
MSHSRTVLIAACVLTITRDTGLEGLIGFTWNDRQGTIGCAPQAAAGVTGDVRGEGEAEGGEAREREGKEQREQRQRGEEQERQRREEQERQRR